MSNYTDIAKIPSALINDIELCKYARSKFDKLLVSTGMSTEDEVDACIDECNPDVVFHTNSTYPSPINQLNLNYIKWLIEKRPLCEIGYSGHEYGLVTTFAAVAIGATWVERHMTIDRTMWGSDHAASVEPQGMIKLVKGIRDIEKSLGENGSRILLQGELSKRESLRK
jgi:N-acetylneuraminate synthase